jgi:hypothetical protein
MAVNRVMSYDPPHAPRHRAGPPWEQASYPPSQQAFPEHQRYPDQRYPDQRYQEQAYPEQGYPEQGYPEQGYGAGDAAAGGGYADAFDGAGYQGWGPSAGHPSGPIRRAPDRPTWDDYRQQTAWGGYPGNGGAPGQDWRGRPGATPERVGGGRQIRADGQRDGTGRPGVIAGAVMGFLAAAVAIGVATLAAAFFRPQASPIIAVGEAFIDRTPPALKEFAVEKFGENDKTMLLLGMYVTIALLAMTIGILARRRVTVGVIGVTVFGLFGAFVAYTRPASKPSDVVPSIIGGIAGVVALLWLYQAATAEPDGAIRQGGSTWAA